MDITVIRGKVVEFDMKSAGPSVLAERGLISDELYQDIVESDGLTRNIAIGNLTRDTKIDEVELAKVIETEIKKYTDMFIGENNIKHNKVLEIAKDAVFLYNSSPKKLRFGDYVYFRAKSRYSLMITFPVSDTNSNKIKLYKKFSGINVRGAKFDKQHPAMMSLLGLLTCLENKDNVKYVRYLQRFIRELKASGSNLINNISNDYLAKVFKEIMA